MLRGRASELATLRTTVSRRADLISVYTVSFRRPHLVPSVSPPKGHSGLRDARLRVDKRQFRSQASFWLDRWANPRSLPCPSVYLSRGASCQSTAVRHEAGDVFFRCAPALSAPVHGRPWPYRAEGFEPPPAIAEAAQHRTSRSGRLKCPRSERAQRH